MWKVEPIGLPPSLRAGFTTSQAPADFQGERFTFEPKAHTESRDSVLSRRIGSQALAMMTRISSVTALALALALAAAATACAPKYIHVALSVT